MSAGSVASADGVSLEQFVTDFASCLAQVDASMPVWTTSKGVAYQAGIGPHPETEVVRLVAAQLGQDRAGRYRDLALGVPYPGFGRQSCDLVIGVPATWAIEVKMLRLMGDNGKTNDNMLMHILSPYPAHRSALTDVTKLVQSRFDCRLAVLIYGFDYEGWPMGPAIDAFEHLARTKAGLGDRLEASFVGLVHPVHRQGRTFAWEVQRP